MKCAANVHDFQLTGNDIRDMRNDLDQNLVIAPYQQQHATGCGYNLTATEFVYSITKKCLLPVRRSAQGETYVCIPPRDTVLVLTREYIKLSENLSGAFYSRVQLVSSGLGHISTTLDPGWSGMLLFSINNPTKKKIKFSINETANGKRTYSGIATMVLNRTCYSGAVVSQVDPSLDNPAMRLDVLKKLVEEPKRWVFNRSYQNLRALIGELEHFEPAASPKTDQLNKVKELLLDLDKEVNSYLSIQEVSAWLTALKRVDCDTFGELRSKLDHLVKVDLLTANVKDDLLDRIEAAQRECDYQLLCDQVTQLHQLIQERVPHVWKHHTLKNILGFLLDHWKIWLLYAISITVLTLCYWYAAVLPEGTDIFIAVAAAVISPLIASWWDHSGPPEKKA